MPRPNDRILYVVLIAFFLAVGGNSIQAGTVPPDSTIFPGLTGRPLIDSLVLHYKTTTTLGYDNGRDTMYGVIDKDGNDSLQCVYSGYTIYMQPGEDPSTWAYDHDINCEHSWPQSQLSGIAVSDLHHLYATEIQVNGDRGDFPFGDIPDDQTTYWYRRNVRTTTIPSTLIDEYAELLSGVRFEPREVQKGNTARSMYYVLTMYKLSDTTAAWWTAQRDYLYAWHSADPADAREITRTRKIATYQQGKKNPFVLDSTLIRRAYFPATGVAGVTERPLAASRLLGNQPNPFHGSTEIRYSLAGPCRAEVVIYNVLGLEVARLAAPSSGQSERSVVWSARDPRGQPQPPGIYFYQLKVEGAPVATRRMLLVR